MPSSLASAQRPSSSGLLMPGRCCSSLLEWLLMPYNPHERLNNLKQCSDLCAQAVQLSINLITLAKTMQREQRYSQSSDEKRVLKWIFNSHRLTVAAAEELAQAVDVSATNAAKNAHDADINHLDPNHKKTRPRRYKPKINRFTFKSKAYNECLPVPYSEE